MIPTFLHAFIIENEKKAEKRIFHRSNCTAIAGQQEYRTSFLYKVKIQTAGHFTIYDPQF
jgi:hypothetical protein